MQADEFLESVHVYCLGCQIHLPVVLENDHWRMADDYAAGTPPWSRLADLGWSRLAGPAWSRLGEPAWSCLGGLGWSRLAELTWSRLAELLGPGWAD